MTLSEKLQNIMDQCNEAENKCSNTEQNQYFAKKLAVFKSGKDGGRRFF